MQVFSKYIALPAKKRQMATFLTQNIDLYYTLIYNIVNIPATPLNNAHPGGFSFLTIA